MYRKVLGGVWEIIEIWFFLVFMFFLYRKSIIFPVFLQEIQTPGNVPLYLCGFNFKWTRSICLFKTSFSLKDLLHWTHLKGLSVPWTVLMCFFKWNFIENCWTLLKCANLGSRREPCANLGSRRELKIFSQVRGANHFQKSVSGANQKYFHRFAPRTIFKYLLVVRTKNIFTSSRREPFSNIC